MTELALGTIREAATPKVVQNSSPTADSSPFARLAVEAVAPMNITAVPAEVVVEGIVVFDAEII